MNIPIKMINRKSTSFQKSQPILRKARKRIENNNQNDENGNSLTGHKLCSELFVVSNLLYRYFARLIIETQVDKFICCSLLRKKNTFSASYTVFPLMGKMNSLVHFFPYLRSVIITFIQSIQTLQSKLISHLAD